MEEQKKLKSVLIEQDIHSALKSFCKAKKHSIGGIVELAILDYLEKHGRPLKR